MSYPTRQECKSKEKDMELAMTELKKAWESLNKTLNNRERDLKAAIKAEDAQALKVVADVPQLSSEEVEGLVEAVKVDQLLQAYHADREWDSRESDWYINTGKHHMPNCTVLYSKVSLIEGFSLFWLK